ncbi:hypothetical protein GJ496_000689 [Pomphorhynchus laevis]|nr:hypothetical protein GJ496_000689 [Pomphorhynchus laevis]
MLTEDAQSDDESMRNRMTVSNRSPEPIENCTDLQSPPLIVASDSTESTRTENASRPSLFDRLKWMMFRMLLFYLVMHFFKPQQNQNRNNVANQPAGKVDIPYQSMFKTNDLLDLYVYQNEFDVKYNRFNVDDLFWCEKRIPFACWKCGPNKDGIFAKSGNISVSDSIANNGTVFIHVFVVHSGQSPNPKDLNYDTKNVYRKIMLNKYKRRVYKKTKNLLTGETDKDEDYQKKAELNLVEIVSHWHPNLTINTVDDQTAWVPGKINAPLDQYIIFDYSSQSYFPILYLNNYWNLNSDYFPINDTLSNLELNLVFTPLKFWKWQIYLSQEMQKSWYSNILGSIDDDAMDQDVLKQTILDTNPYILALTMLVSVLHTFFEILAFKNDIQFWKNRSNLEGLSIRTLLFNIFTSLIVVLYVFDNQTNFAIRMSVAFGLLIEFWKVPKILNISIDRSKSFFGIFPHIKMEFKSSYKKSSTSEHDKTAFKYLSIVLFPLVASYAVYSLIYNEHKGWYSWVLNMIYGFLLTFGFIMMTPQLFINYKLKSVAHLPWRMMTYKALNTFIDDIFAFVVKTPFLYRISCFRDDIIFFIYLYQRWIYRVDHSRVNEFGISGEDCLAQTNESDKSKVD